MRALGWVLLLGAFTSTDASQKIFGRQIRQVLLLHIGAFDARMLDRLLTNYEHLGVRFIGLRRALEDEAYRTNGDVKTDEPLSFFHRHARLANKEVQSDPGVPLQELEQSCR